MVNAIKSNATTIVNSHEIGYIPSSIILYIVFTVYYHSRVIFPDVLAQLITDKIANKRRHWLRLSLFDGNPWVIITIGCVATDRLRESPPPGKCKHNVLVVFDC